MPHILTPYQISCEVACLIGASWHEYKKHVARVAVQFAGNSIEIKVDGRSAAQFPMTAVLLPLDEFSRGRLRPALVHASIRGMIASRNVREGEYCGREPRLRSASSRVSARHYRAGPLDGFFSARMSLKDWPRHCRRNTQRD